ncbi:surf1, partial [Symbiodinium sp. KB8]
SQLMYPTPFQVEGSVIIRLVRLSDPVTSPVARTVRNRQYGIRGDEKWQLLATGAACFLLVSSLGMWQLKRMKWKKELIEMRRQRLAMPRIQVTGSPFPWKDQVPDFIYRVVEVRGVFDHSNEMHVGPRPGADESGETTPGVLVVTPLRLEDLRPAFLDATSLVGS